MNAILFFGSLVNIVETTLIDGLLPMQPLFQSKIPSINLVFNQIYHRIDGIFLASSKFGQRRLVIYNEELTGGFKPIRNFEIFE